MCKPKNIYKYIFSHCKEYYLILFDLNIHILDMFLNYVTLQNYI